jgi:hypothetical protein
MSATSCRSAITSVLQTYAAPPSIFPENTTVPTAISSGEWVRWSIRDADWFDATIGADRERGVGILYFQHFNPEGRGTKEAYDFADKIGTLLNRKRVAGSDGVLLFDRAVCKYAGTIGGKVQHNVTIDFEWNGEALNAA